MRTTMVSVRLEIEPQLRVVDRAELFEGFYWFMSNRARTVYDYDRANDRFLMVTDLDPGDDGDDPDPSLTLHVLIDWFDELRRRVPSGR